MSDRLFFALPGSIETRTGGTIYDKRLIGGLRALGWQVELAEWPASFPFPRRADRQMVASDLAHLPDGTLTIIDGLAFGVLDREVLRHAERLNIVALVHHPLALESGLSPQAQAGFRVSEQSALKCARAVIVTSRMTARGLIQDYGVPAERITVAYPGTDAPVALAQVRHDDHGGPVLLAVGTVSARKGYDLLVDALAPLADLDWSCRIAGSLDRAPEATVALRERIIEAGLQHRIHLLGEVASMVPLYEAADIFVLPSRYEGYGMAFAEALRQGLPVVGCRAGAVPEVVPDSAGLLVEPDDAAALSEALRHLITDREKRRSMAEGALLAGMGLPSWNDTARQVNALLRDLVQVA
ncbi:MAG TPA: glycosyltransferase family 4 protein [Stellaceae bacterium]|nr:glycosyltransferase family 4 protein [Stellaceae bacterium]